MTTHVGAATRAYLADRKMNGAAEKTLTKFRPILALFAELATVRLARSRGPSFGSAGCRPGTRPLGRETAVVCRSLWRSIMADRGRAGRHGFTPSRRRLSCSRAAPRALSRWWSIWADTGSGDC
jgi:hypothetical protein